MRAINRGYIKRDEFSESAKRRIASMNNSNVIKPMKYVTENQIKRLYARDERTARI